ncbi:MAG: PTS sugar transporter subunit IIA [Clostridiaceae bacterium]
MDSLIETRHIRIQAEATDWREAIRVAGSLLVKSSCIEEGYVESMIRAVEELGPYMVILPGFALAHAAPSADVHQDAMSLVTLCSPVNFGSAENDPVRVVLCLSCVDRESHIASLQRVATVLMEDDMVDKLAAAGSVEEIQTLLTQKD